MAYKFAVNNKLGSISVDIAICLIKPKDEAFAIEEAVWRGWNVKIFPIFPYNEQKSYTADCLGKPLTFHYFLHGLKETL